MRYFRIIICLFIANCGIVGALADRVLYAQEADSLLVKYRQMAVEYNNDLKKAERSINASIEREKSAVKDKLPQLQGGAAYQYTARPMEISANIPALGELHFGGNNYNQYGLTMQLIQPIYMGGQILNNIKMARETMDLMESQLEQVRLLVNYQTDVQYWSTVARNENISIQQSYFEQVDNLVEIIKTRVDAGLIDRQQLLMAQVKLNEAKLKVLYAENSFETGLMALNSFIGLDLNNDTKVESNINVNKNYLLESADSVVRPELLMAQSRVNIAQTKQKLAASKYNPKFYVGADGSYSSPGYNFKKDMNLNGSVYAKLSVPIWTGGKRKNDVSAAKEEYYAFINDYDKISDQIELDTKTAQINYYQSVERYNLAQSSLSIAQENEKQATEKYEEGKSSVLEVIDAQIYTLTAKEQLMKSKLDVKLAIAEYNFYICNYE